MRACHDGCMMWSIVYNDILLCFKFPTGLSVQGKKICSYSKQNDCANGSLHISIDFPCYYILHLCDE